MNIRFLHSVIFLLLISVYQNTAAQPVVFNRIDMGETANGYSITPDWTGGYLIFGTYRDPGASSGYDVIVRTDSGGVVLSVTRSLRAALPQGAVVPLHDSGFLFVSPYYQNNATTAIHYNKNNKVVWVASLTLTIDGQPPISAIETKDHGVAIIRGSVIWRLDSNGMALWSSGIGDLFSGAAGPELVGISELADGSFLLLGSTNASASNRIHVVKLSSSGSMLSDNIYRTDTSHHLSVSAMTKTKDGGFALCGAVIDSVHSKCYFIKLGSDAKPVLSKELDIDTTIVLNSIAEAANGDLILVGLRSSQISDPQINFDNSFVIRLSSAGDVSSMNEVDIPKRGGYLKGVAVDAKGNIGLLGTAEQILFKDTAVPTGLLFIRYKNDGDLCYVGSHSFTSSAIALTEDSIHFPFSPTITQSTLFGIDAVSVNYVEQPICLGAGVPRPPVNNGITLSVSPNPLSDNSQIHVTASGIEQPGIYSLAIMDLLGNSLKKETVNFTGAEQDVPLEVSSLPSGMYFIELRNEADPEISVRAKFIRK